MMQNVSGMIVNLIAAKSGKKLTKELLKVSELPSFARLCINVIMIEENFIGGRASANRTGWLIGSVSTPIFDA